jgi:uroporphyrinogen decarboxylase
VTPFERLGSTLSGTFADRRLAAPLLSLYGAALAGTPTERHYRDAKLYAAGQRAVAERFAPDVLFGPFALALEAEAYGAELAWPADAPPTVRKPLRGAAALASGAAPAGPGLDYLAESVRLTAEAVRGDRPVAAALTAPTDLPALVLGIDAWLEILLFEPSAAAELLARSEEHFSARAAALFRAGATFVVVPIMFANPAILTDDLIRALMIPSLGRAFGSLPGPVVFHHGGNPLARRIGLFAELPNVVGFALDGSDDPAVAREALGDGPLLLGGPTGPNLRRMSPEAAAEAVRRLLRNRAGDPRFAVATSAADVPLDTPPKVIDAVLEAVRKEARPDG